MIQNNSGFRAVIITALPAEYQAVRTRLKNVQKVVSRNETIYERGTFSGEGQEWEITLVEAGHINTNIVLGAERAIDASNPRIILFVTIAGGLKNVDIGDVVAATKVYSYETGKSADTPFQTAWCASYSLEQRVRAEAREGKWHDQLKTHPQSRKPRAFVAPIAAEKILPSTLSNISKFLKPAYRDALAVEMQGNGFLQAVYANQFVESLVICGISDLIDRKTSINTLEAQEVASVHASAFAFQVLNNLARLDPIPTSIAVAAPLVAPTQPDAIKIFYNYANEDEKLVNQLQDHLLPLRRRGLITDWHGGRIAPEASLTEERRKQLDSAQIILFFVSPDFISSEYCHEVVLAAMERNKEKDAIVVPIMLRNTDWQETPFSHIQGIPRENKPVVEFSNRDKAFSEIAKEIRSIVERRKKGAYWASASNS